ncbi:MULTISPECIES: GMP synthase (glutamine-hydrolyzing) [Metallosphaera]|uniref:GMP synthase (glutamine-hydrolyzing) n=3 Tax=Metallosphaera TaxID=41980 RepID=A4YD75_METS5|nr:MULTISPECIES: ATP-binding protein [Metallosphaera]ABP94377.1 GMP synthase (glutamine-hydrolyzing) [Metallosphaera sedula DSM 5348]AIM26364.1 GMP synthase (glutamine-hydrolyzing) [Metallosphaera sedula]AKV73373.1 GMP synthase [Metallosphaera sedula]AKV75617.1 GMP synthase [Metallosphaera sedula]AKV77863.1 GMP synthase [Metallosphaera sedula]
MFSPEKFIEEIEPQIRSVVGDNRVVAAVSGGVDSTTAAALMYRILGDKVTPVMIDTGFLRENEANRVKDLLKSVMPLKIVDRSERFISSIEGLEDAEEKRKKFRDVFYSTISEIVAQENSRFLVQGTIAPDWIETQGGIKTQHNVLVQLGINTEKTWGFSLVEPLADLYKNEVRELARYLGLPREISERQPFPGPGLLVRCVGRLSKEKLEITRKSNAIVEDLLEPLRPSQYFAAVFESNSSLDTKLSELLHDQIMVYSVKSTGVKGDVRTYGKMASFSLRDNYTQIREISQKITSGEYTRALMRVRTTKGKYTVAIRAVSTEDFMTADIVEIDPSLLSRIADELLRIPGVGEVVYDVTTKPPATIEFE